MAWNLESLFEKITLQGVCEFIKAFDVICLAETFTLPTFDFNIKFDDYITVHWPAEKFSTLGRPSGGLVVLYKRSLEPFIEVIKTNISHIICLKISKNILNSTKDLLLVSTYIHPTTSIFYSNKDYDNTLDMLEHFISEEQAKEDDMDIMVAGDLNARLGDWSYSQEPPDQETQGEETTYYRSTKDNQFNPNGRKVIEICNTLNLTPLSGLSERNFDNNFTFISKRGNSTIDHFLCSPDFLPSVLKYKTINRVESQHLPIAVTLNSNMNTAKDTAKHGEIKKTKWKEEKKQECKNILDNQEAKKLLQEATTAMEADNIEESVSIFTRVMQMVSKPLEYIIQIGKTKMEKKTGMTKNARRRKKRH